MTGLTQADEFEAKREQRRFHMRVERLEYLRCYFWTGKDIGWYILNPNLAYSCALGAMLVSLVILFHSVWNKYFATAIFAISVSFWLLGNLFWMLPEVSLVGSETPFHTHENHQLLNLWAQISFIASICLILVQMLILGPLNIISDPIESNDSGSSYFVELGLVPSFVPHKLVIGWNSSSCRAEMALGWQTYEHLWHLWWVCKDFAWVTHYKPLWCVAVFFTVVISADFIITSASVGRKFEALHYLGTSMWLSGNIIWSFGEFFNIGQEKTSSSIFNTTEIHACRYWAAILVILSMAPYIYAYFMTWKIAQQKQKAVDAVVGIETTGSLGITTVRPRLRSVVAVPGETGDQEQQMLLLAG